MAALSDYAENLLLNFLMTGTGSAPSNLYLGLYTTAPNDAGGGTELSGNGYSRQAITFNTASGTSGTTDNSNTQSFTASGGDFGNIVALGIFDAQTSGNLLWHGTIATNKTVYSGDSIQFAAGSIDLTIA